MRVLRTDNPHSNPVMRYDGPLPSRKNYRTPLPVRKPERLKPFADSAPERPQPTPAQARRDRIEAAKDVALDVIRNRYKGNK